MANPNHPNDPNHPHGATSQQINQEAANAAAAAAAVAHPGQIQMGQALGGPGPQVDSTGAVKMDNPSKIPVKPEPQPDAAKLSSEQRIINLEGEVNNLKAQLATLLQGGGKTGKGGSKG